jgi:HEXXH motif-containing protein
MKKNKLKEWHRNNRFESFTGMVWNLHFPGALELCKLVTYCVESLPETLDCPLWDDINRRILDIKRLDEDDSSINVDYLGLVNDTNRILAGSSIKNRVPISLEIDLNNGLLSLPILEKTFHFGKHLKKVIVEVSPSSCQINGVDINLHPSVSHLRINVGHQQFFLNSNDLIYEKWCSLDKNTISLLNVSFEKKWIKSASQATYILNKYWPSKMNMVAPFIIDIVPTNKKTNNESYSASSRDMIGSVISSHVDGFELIEMLVHENAHSYLNILMKKYSLINHNKPLYYSPLKGEKRPPSAIIHSFYSFVCIAQYYSHLLVDDRLNKLLSEKYAETIFILKVLSKAIDNEGFLTEKGKKFINEISSGIARLYKLSRFSPELILDRTKHFEWFVQKNPDYIYTSQYKDLTNLFNEIKKQPENKQINKPFKAYKYLAQKKNINFYWDKSGPFVVKDLKVFSNNLFEKGNIDLFFANQLADIIDISSHRGDGHTETSSLDLISYLKSLKNKNIKSYLGEQSINDWPGISPELIRSCLREDFFINNNQLLLFLNRKDCHVKLHYDSGNNFHFNIWGKKTFYLMPPSDSSDVYESQEDYGEGFSPINPFEDFAIRYPKFPFKNGEFITLESDDCLFIPSGWWHAVKYDEESLSISCFDIY